MVQELGSPAERGPGRIALVLPCFAVLGRPTSLIGAPSTGGTSRRRLYRGSTVVRQAGPGSQDERIDGACAGRAGLALRTAVKPVRLKTAPELRAPVHAPASGANRT